MRRYVLGRLVWLVLVLVGASLLTFGIGPRPRDPAQIVLQRQLGPPPTEAQIRETLHDLGFDRPLPIQYLDWLSDLLRGDPVPDPTRVRR